MAHVRSFLAFTLAWASVAGGATAAAPPDPPKPSKPVALLVALEDYPQAPLSYPVNSCLKLAGLLADYGYSVRVLTDAKSLDRAKAAAPKGKGVEVAAVENANALNTQVRQWVNVKLGDYKAPPTLGLLVFSGHGVTRDGKHMVLTRADTPVAGGVDVTDIQTDADFSRLPLLMVIDTCRTPADKLPAAGQPAVPAGRGIGLARGRGSVRKGGPGAVTTLWAGKPGRLVPDDPKDLVGCLADAMAFDPARKRFLAELDWPRWVAPDPKKPQAPELTVERWWTAAAVKYQFAHPGQVHDWLDGTVQPGTVVAGRPTSSPTANPVRGRLATDLLAGWNKTFGGFEAERIGPGVRLIRGPGIVDKFGYCEGTIALPAGTSGRTLVLEVVGEGVTGFQLHAKDDSSPPVHFNVSPISIVYNPADRTMKEFHIPLGAGKDGQKLSVVGVATDSGRFDRLWPPDAALTVTGLRLVPTAGLPKRQVPDPGTERRTNLLADWCHVHIPPPPFGKLAAAVVANEKREPLLKLSAADLPAGTDGWRGGPVDPPAYVPKRAAVEVQVQASGSAPGAKAEVRLYAGEELVGEESIPLAGAATTPVRVRVKGPTFVDYMTLTTDSKTVTLSRIVVVPTD